MRKHLGYVTWLAAATLLPVDAVLAKGDPAADWRAMVDGYCVTCHNDALLTAGLSLQHASLDDVGASADVWEKVLRKLQVQSMPPSGVPRPAAEAYEGFAAFLEKALDRSAMAEPDPGRPAMRRLNRTEYLNAVRDLLAVEIGDVSILPEDDTMFGFDNVGDVLSLSPLLAERYIAAARKVRRQALGEPDMQPVSDVYSVSAALMQDDRMGEDMPFGSRGGLSVRHHFPVDGDYVAKIRLQRNSREYIRGMLEPHEFDVRLDGESVGRRTIGGRQFGRSGPIFSSASTGDPEQERYERYADEDLEIRFFAKAGTRTLTVTFLDDNTVPAEPAHARHTLYDYAQYKGGVPGVHTVAIGGPYNPRGIGETSSRRKILSCDPPPGEEAACAKEILSRLATRAYQRPPTEVEVAELMAFYDDGAAESFEQGIGLAIERILAGPEFLFVLVEQPGDTNPGNVFAISERELATQVALFLWRSLPDDELLSLAEAGRLSAPGVLEQQIRRMLDDPRSDTLVSSFASQWLQLGKLNVTQPNTDLFPYFEDNLREAFRKETELFFEHVLRNDRPLLELLDADYTFVNERLARHYGIADVYGSHFRRVGLPDDRRGGLLGQGSILTVTSYPNRTAPTIRGKWILENVLGSPPPPPPPNVPSLRQENDQGQVLNMRQQMEQHRANPVCASCHKAMDPLGFALENYDAIGKWRTIDAASGAPIDASGTLPDGTPFSGLAELRAVLVARRQNDFVMTTIERLMTYALGRGIDHRDGPVMRAVMREAAPDDYRLSSIIAAIVKSTPFQMRRIPSHDAV